MRFLRHEAALDRPDANDVTVRAILTEQLRRGDLAARAQLTPPDVPDTVAYLHRWACELHGRSGLSELGMAPLTYSTIADWARLTGIMPTADEVAALLDLDAALMGVAVDPEPTPDRPARVWGEKRNPPSNTPSPPAVS